MRLRRFADPTLTLSHTNNKKGRAYALPTNSTKMKTYNYTREDLSTAGLVFALKGRKDQFGNAFYPDWWIEWAREVMRYFALAAWEQVRKGAKTLKMAYSLVFSLSVPQWVVPEGVSGRKLQRLATNRVQRGVFNIINLLT